MLPNQSHRRRSDLRRSLGNVYIAWSFGAVWLFIVMGAASTEFARLLGVSAFGFGLLAAAPFVGALTQLPVSFVIERYGHRKAIFMTGGIAARSIWILLAVIPWALPREAWAPALVGGTALAMLLLQATGPAWMSWGADLIPSRLRGRYMARRIRLGQGIGLVTTLLIGFGLDRSAELAGDDLRNAISAAYIIAAFCGVIDYLWHLPVHIPDPPRRERKSLLRLMREPLADRSFRWFIAFTGTLTFATGYVGQFVNLYMIEHVAIDKQSRFLLVNTMLVAIPLLVMMLTLPIWGRLMDRFGRRPVMIIAGVLMAHGGASWIFVTPHNWWFGYLTVIVATAAWPAIEVGNFNILLSMADSKAGTRSGTAYVAVNSIVVAVAGTLSGLFGGAVAEWIGPDWRGAILGFPLTYHGVLMIISGVLRLVAIGIFARVHEPGSAPTRQAARYILGGLYSNVIQVAAAPGGMVAGLVGRFRRMSWLAVRRPAQAVAAPQQVRGPDVDSEQQPAQPDDAGRSGL